jgi:hypothetical protein
MLVDGELYVDNLRRAEATDTYTAGGADVADFEPRFTYHGFRYVEVDGLPGDLSEADVVARVLQVLPAAPVGRVRLHPSLVSAEAVRDLVARGLEIVPDSTLGPADALVESTDGAVVDLRIDEALGRVREVLS